MYISRTAGRHYAETLGLGNNVITQGLAQKVFIPTKNMGSDTVMVQGDGYMDVNGTLTLWDSVFEAPESLAKRHCSVGRPSFYVTLLGSVSCVARDSLSRLICGDSLPQTRRSVTSRELTTAIRQGRIKSSPPTSIRSQGSTCGSAVAYP